MRRAAYVSVLAMVCAGFALAAKTTELSGGVAPDFVLKSTAGENLRLSEYRGEIVMLSFWASWCGDCRAQLEELGRLHDRYREAGVALLTVNFDRNAHDAERAAAAVAFGAPVLRDPSGTVGKLYAADRLPLAVLIDRSGVVRHVFEGHRRGNEQQYLERVQALLRE